MKRLKWSIVTGIVLLLGSICGCAGQKIKVIPEEEFFSYGTQVELTTDNWNQYFETAEGSERERRQYDGTELVWRMQLAPKAFCVTLGEGAKFRLQGTYRSADVTYVEEYNSRVATPEVEKTFSAEFLYGDDPRAGELYLCRTFDEGKGEWTDEAGNPVKLSFEVSMETELVELVCEEAEGTVLAFQIPEDAWNTESEGIRYLLVGTKQEAFRIYERTFYDDVRRFFKQQGGTYGGGA